MAYDEDKALQVKHLRQLADAVENGLYRDENGNPVISYVNGSDVTLITEADVKQYFK